LPSDQFNEILEVVRAMSVDVPENPTWSESRARLDLLGAAYSVPNDIDVTPVEIAGVRCERFAPRRAGAAPAGQILYFHGGAYTAGSLTSHRALTGRLAAACSCEVLAVDYRLAPEYPHPAGLDDALSVYRAITSGGTPPERVIVSGDSAGGGLAMALLLSLRDRDDELPVGAVLLSPWLDLSLSGDAVTSRAAEDPMLRAAGLARSAAAYAGDDLRRPLVSPLFADPTGLPPLLVLVGTAEILLDDSVTLADRARAAGVDVVLDVQDGLIHVWPFIDGIPESAAALERIAGWIKQHLGSA